jgi:hypothetical protein
VACFKTITELCAEKIGLPFVAFPKDPLLAPALGAALLEEVEEDAPL